ncbi:alpha/beta hydrolase [Microbacteriaceae bacterium VKM Ac-2854]|nr:alpha/beta hydrolase [Microbacteriaceae bacterium VKM Ac-2854]
MAVIEVNGIDLWVEEFGDATTPGVVLVPGAASPSDWWDDEFCRALADGGYRVLRYDLRDTGQSTTRPAGAADYTGDDLVADLAALIERTGIAPAVVVGISLGGGLAQQLAIARPRLVRSLVLMSTSPGGPGSEGQGSEGQGSDGQGYDELPPMSPELAAAFEQDPNDTDPSDPDPNDTDASRRDAAFRRILAEERLFGGTIPIDESRIRRISDRIIDRSIDLEAGSNHWSIASASGTREQLRDISAPTLVIHGAEDPLFPPGHGEALAREIPGASLLIVPGLGHQFPPPPIWPIIVPAILDHLDDARRSASAG